jgi:predicted DNA-binding protein
MEMERLQMNVSGVPAELRERLQLWADEEDRPLAALVRRILTQAVEAHEREAGE